MKKPSDLWNRHNILLIILILLLLPFVIGTIYDFLLPHFLSFTLGDLLAFYGAALGIFSSVIVYKKQKRKEEIQPRFFVEVEKQKDYKNLFNIKITKEKDVNLYYVYLYDEFLTAKLEETQTIPVTFDLKVEEKEPEARYNFTMDRGILDADGYPKYVQITCKDIDGNAWTCDFNRGKGSDKMYYFPKIEMG